MTESQKETQLSLLGDDELLKRIQACDVEAWGEIVSRHASAVFALAVTITHDHSTASDAVQETFIIARKSASSFRYGKDARSWLLKIASREALRLVRRRAGDERRLTEEMEINVAMQSTNENPGLDLEQEELMHSLRKAMDKLPLILRSTIALRFFAGMTQSEIAKELKCERSTVSTRISQALARLKNDLGPVHGAQVTFLLPALMSTVESQSVPSVLQQKLAQIGNMRPSQLLQTVRTEASQRTAIAVKAASGSPSFLIIFAILCTALGLSAYFILEENPQQPAFAASEQQEQQEVPAAKQKIVPEPAVRSWHWQLQGGIPKDWVIAEGAKPLQWQASVHGEQGVISAGSDAALVMFPVDLSQSFVLRYRWRPATSWQQAITVDHPSNGVGFPARKNWQARLSLPPRLMWAEYEHYFVDGWMISKLKIGKQGKATTSRISRYELNDSASSFQQSLIIRDVLLSEVEIKELTKEEILKRVGDPELLSKDMGGAPQQFAAGVSSFGPLFKKLSEGK